MIKHKNLVPRQHQIDAVSAAVEEFKLADRTTIVMASGTGKSATGVWCAGAHLEGCRSSTIVCFFPSLALIRQTIPLWVAEQPWGDDFRFLAVCSDRSVVEDDICTSDMPFPTTTNQEEIACFMAAGGMRVIFATYHSSEAISEALSKVSSVVDLAIFDEAHRTAGSPGSAFINPLSDTTFPCNKRLFMTATPRVTNRRKRDKAGDALVTSMDDEKVYGRVAYRLSFRQAVALGLICSYKVLVSTVTTAELGAKPDDAFVDFRSERLSLRAAADRIALARAIEMVGAKKIISFHSTVAEAHAFVEVAGVDEMLPGIQTYHVNGTQDTYVREGIIERFATAPVSLISNARCLTEGVDIPAVDLVAFVSPKKSKIDIIQAIGRAMRKSAGSGKEIGYILLPVLLDAERDIEDALRSADLSVMWDVLSALMDEDEVFSEFVRSNARGDSNEAIRFDDIVEILGSHVDIDGLRRATEVSVVEALSDNFDFKVRIIRKFVDREGHARIPAKHIEDGYKIGKAVVNLRSRRDRLSAEKVRLLSNISGWIWDARFAEFLDGVEVLKRFVDREGHAFVQQAHVENGMKLGHFVNNLRSRKNFLDVHHKEVLEAIQGWSWRGRDRFFEEPLEKLKIFSDREGHTLVPVRNNHPERKLGLWVIRMRASRELLTDDQRSSLEEIDGWVWDAEDFKFLKGLNALMRFVEREGHALVPSRHIEEAIQLGYWVRNQRQRRMGMPHTRREMLERIPGWVWRDDARKRK